MRWFISDLHLGDPSVIKRRYSTSVDELDAFLANRWDVKVKPDDHVWVLGDVARGRSQEYLQEWFAARPGYKHLVRGNWDEGKDWSFFDTVQGQEGFLTLASGRMVALSHYPYGHRLNPEFPLTLLHGHTHSSKKVKRSAMGELMVHVGWDAWRRMVSETDIVNLIREEGA